MRLYAYQRWILKGMLGLFALAAVAAVLLPVHSCPYLPVGAALSNLKEVGTSLALYQSDFDDRLPLAQSWADATSPYRSNDSILWTPGAAKGETTVAFVTRLGASNPKNPELQVMAFETRDRRRNANSNFTDVWWQKDRTTVVTFANTSAKRFRYYGKHVPGPGTGLVSPEFWK